MKMLVVGAGAVGGNFGGQLARAGRDVTFLLRSARAEKLRANGLTVTDGKQDWTVHPKVVTSAELDGSYDVIILSVKAYSLDAAITDFAAAVGPETMILPGLNGMAHLDKLAGRFGQDAVLGGVTMVVSTLDDEGRVVQLNGEPGGFVYGDRRDPESTRLKALDEQMQGAGFTARLSENIMLDMWQKWVMLATTGALNCLMRGNSGEVASAPGGQEFAASLLAEAAAIAEASGYPIPQAYLTNTRTRFLDPTSAAMTSMYRDLTRGYDVESEQIVGDLVARAGALGVAAPLFGLAYTNLSVYRNRLVQG